jgi:hypothetical protein
VAELHYTEFDLRFITIYKPTFQLKTSETGWQRIYYSMQCGICPSQSVSSTSIVHKPGTSRFTEFLTTGRMKIQVFWDTHLLGLPDREDGNKTCLRDVVNCLPVDRMSHSTRRQSSFSHLLLSLLTAHYKRGTSTKTLYAVIKLETFAATWFDSLLGLPAASHDLKCTTFRGLTP